MARPPAASRLPSLIPLVLVALLLLGGGAEPTFGPTGDLYQPGAGLLDGLSGPPLLIGGPCVWRSSPSPPTTPCVSRFTAGLRGSEIKITAARSVLGDEDFAAAVRHGEAQASTASPDPGRQRTVRPSSAARASLPSLATSDGGRCGGERRQHNGDLWS